MLYVHLLLIKNFNNLGNITNMSERVYIWSKDYIQYIGPTHMGKFALSAD